MEKRPKNKSTALTLIRLQKPPYNTLRQLLLPKFGLQAKRYYDFNSKDGQKIYIK